MGQTAQGEEEEEELPAASALLLPGSERDRTEEKLNRAWEESPGHSCPALQGMQLPGEPALPALQPAQELLAARAVAPLREEPRAAAAMRGGAHTRGGHWTMEEGAAGLAGWVPEGHTKPPEMERQEEAPALE